MEMPVIRNILNELSCIGFVGRISFHFYNEPLLDERIPSIIKLTRKLIPRSRIVLYTNGDLLTLDLFRELIQYGCDLLLVTEQENAFHDFRWIEQLSLWERNYLFYQTYRNPEILYTNRGGLLPYIADVREPLHVPCTAPSTTCVITAKGSVVLCYEDYLERIVIGNIHNSTIEDIWNSNSFHQLRTKLAFGDRTVTELCRKCNNTENQGYEQVD
jgi:radical SAM protein with 4Fe4S-binding SPASM domain